MADLGTTTATILFTDVVGSTELRSRLGESAADRVFIEHRRRLGTVIARHGGHIVKYTGDGVMASFSAASTAVHAAIAIQADVAEHGAGIVVRVGVAVGDVTREGDDYFGLPVVAAARLEAAAEGGQILVTESVRLLAGDRAGDRYEPLGPLKLKGIADPVVAYAVDWDRPPALADGDAGWARPSLPLRPRRLRPPSLRRPRRRTSPSSGGPGTRAGRARARIVLIGGEAGAGKTRLASEFAHEAHEQGAWVLYGGCDDDLALPYQPWVQAADQLLAAMPKPALEGAVAAELAPLAQLLTRAEWLAAQPSKATVDPDAARYRTLRRVRHPARRGGPERTRARGPRRSPLGRTADARPAAAPRPDGAPERRPRRRYVPRHGRRGHRLAVELPGRPAARRRARSVCTSPGSTSTPSSASSPRRSVTSSTRISAGSRSS